MRLVQWHIMQLVLGHCNDLTAPTICWKQHDNGNNKSPTSWCSTQLYVEADADNLPSMSDEKGNCHQQPQEKLPKNTASFPAVQKVQEFSCLFF